MADDDALERWEQLWPGYTESQGHPILREEIAELYDKIQVDNVLTVVSEEGIFIPMQFIIVT